VELKIERFVSAVFHSFRHSMGVNFAIIVNCIQQRAPATCFAVNYFSCAMQGITSSRPIVLSHEYNARTAMQLP